MYDTDDRPVPRDDNFGENLSAEEREFMRLATRTTKSIAKEKKQAAHVDEPAPEVFLKRGDDVELSTHLIGDLMNDGTLVYTESVFYQCRGDLWHEVDDDDVSQRIHTYVDMPVQVIREDKAPAYRPLSIDSSKRKGVLAEAKIKVSYRNFFNEAPSGVAFKNFFVYVEGKEIKLVSLEERHRVRAYQAMPFDFPEGTFVPPVLFEAFLHQLWDGCEDVEERIRYLYEWLGLARLGLACQHKDTPLLIGLKDTGKSVLLNLIAELFAPGSRRTVTLHAMDNEYHRAHLVGGQINFVNELPARDLLTSEPAKAILSGDQVNCRRPHQPPFDWKPTCAHIFAANELPPVRDDALVGRFVVLDCPNVVPPHLQDKQLPQKLLKEIQSITAKAIWHAQDVLTRGHIERPSSSVTAGDDWKKNSDPIRIWADESLVETTASTDITTPGPTLYRHYTDWSKENGHVAVSQTRFGLRLKSLGFRRRRSNVPLYFVSLMTPTQQTARAAWSERRYNND